MSRPVEYLRADAARNVHRIVEVAARLLADNPNLAMADVVGDIDPRVRNWIVSPAGTDPASRR
jgi:hypothetical protein